MCLINPSFHFQCLRNMTAVVVTSQPTCLWSFGGDLGQGHSSFLFFKLRSHQQERVVLRDPEFRAVRQAPVVLVRAPSGHRFI